MESVLTSAVQKLGNPLLQEGIFLYGVKDQVKWVQAELQRIRCFLEDANDKQRKGDARMRNWVREVTDVSYDAEDAIDSYMHQVEDRRQRQGILGCIDWYASIPSLLMARHKLGKDIEGIKLHIDQILRGTTTYKIGNLGEITGREDQEIDELLESRRRSPPLDDNDYINIIVGFEVHRQGLVNQLLSSDTKRRYIVSIVGMGGLGKSTLAKMVYNDSKIRKSFHVCIWVIASQDFGLRLFLEDLAMKTIGTTEGRSLEQRVCDFLRNKVYLIVIDDVWGTDVWRKIGTMLPDVGNGSRVLLTTRSESVAKYVEPIIPFFSLPLLTDEESWTLFIRKAFPTERGIDSVCPQKFEASGRRMVKRCGRLPLALLVLGGLLSSKTTPLSWLQVEETMDWESIEDEQQCLNVLALSYRNLPDHNLRSCFLYLALFPEDSEISASELIRLWIAEGFIPQERRKTLEDTARGFLDKFNQWSMIQVSQRETDGGISGFKIHDLLREICLAESKEVKFFDINPTSCNYDFSRSRRLALYNPNAEICIHGSLPSNLRSLFLRFEMPISGLSKMLHGLEFLRVLELQGPRKSEGFPKPIKSMTHLRYLKLTGINELPSAIGNFRNLETLDLSECLNILTLPEELGELPNLRHVFFWVLCEACFPSIGTSTNLRTLKRIRCDQLWVQESLPRLQYLRCLDISSYSGNGEVLCDSISKLNHLASLEVYSSEIPQSIITSLSDNPHLVKLHIKGQWAPQRWLPESGNFPPNLTELSLSWSELEKDPMPVLEKLPNLMFLYLGDNAYLGKKMVCTTGGFLQLQTLELCRLENLEDWVVQAGAFPKLARLDIIFCVCLEMLPEGLQHVKSLMNLEVYDERAEFINRLQKDVFFEDTNPAWDRWRLQKDVGDFFEDTNPAWDRWRLQKDVGDDWHKIKHVPNISSNFDILRDIL